MQMVESSDCRRQIPFGTVQLFDVSGDLLHCCLRLLCPHFYIPDLQEKMFNDSLGFSQCHSAILGKLIYYEAISSNN
jgi:hypothetical protein